ncbi:MAG: S9 family peptidase [Bdellovibrionaceae bacterium]|nr:S9 family peptidase [Pseudobdellovibrionaceae bacterium]
MIFKALAKHRSIMLSSLVLVFSVACTHKKTTSPSTVTSTDPFIQLEDIRSTDSMAWVKSENEISAGHLKAQPGFDTLKSNIKDILASKDRIPAMTIIDEYVYNHWTDEKNPRGLWRRTKLTELNKKTPHWEILLDVDALGKAENESWVLKRTEILRKDFTRALVFLSRKGKDATIMREFDLTTKTFIKDGFTLPEAKMTVTWIDKDTLMLGTDFGEDSKTDSGYPRMIKTWKRNQKLVDARLLIQTPKQNTGTWVSTIHDGKTSYPIIVDRINFYDNNYYALTPNLEPKKLPIPLDSELDGIFNGDGYYLVKREMKTPSRTFQTGSLLKFSIAKFLADTTQSVEPDLVFLSTPNQIYSGISFSKNKRWLTVLNQVNPNIFELTDKNELKPLKLPTVGNSSLMTTADNSDLILVTYSNFNQPTTLYSYEHNRLKKMRSLPAFFKADDIVVEQKWATSKDGTKVPYYLIKNKKHTSNAKNPTLLYAYGGFEVAMQPYYSAVMGKAWLETGGTYVLANIRGGGEFGPSWHQSALKLNRQRAFDDFYAVAEDLIRTKVTSPAHLGIMGGSNGGLLMGVAMTQRPDLFKAVLCEVPLLDMARYHLLLAGASWVAEYGSPENPQERDYLLSYSPYQNVKIDKVYPEVFITTSTEDDRVHPGHARKMAAKLKSLGKPYMYFENTEGGHGRTADLNQAAEYMAMQYIFLKEKLF